MKTAIKTKKQAFDSGSEKSIEKIKRVVTSRKVVAESPVYKSTSLNLLGRVHNVTAQSSSSQMSHKLPV
jgi:hypothetical protein